MVLSLPKARTVLASRFKQRGAALILTLVLIAVGVAFATASSTHAVVAKQKAENSTRAVLFEAKEALIASAVSHATKPGALPCPDTDDDGLENGISGSECPSYIGRLPWRTLGLGDLRDNTGERLWYAVSNNFRNLASIQINSDTKGNRTVYGNSDNLTLSNQAAAIIFAPGSAVGTQRRDGATADCQATGTMLRRDRCATNYLESASGVNNASSTGPYIAAQEGLAFNDRLMVIRTSDLMPLVEQRVAGELRDVLIAYRDRSADAISGGGCNCYPWADSDNDGLSNTGNNRGRVPLTALPHNWGAVLNDPISGIPFPALPTLPPYFQSNGWTSVVFYAVGRNALQNFGVAPTACTTCTVDPASPPPALLQGTLSVDGTSGSAVVLITPASAGATRPSSAWANYIDDAANKDSDDRFIKPASRAFDRDRIFTIPDDTPPTSCEANAKILVKSAPCHTTGNNVKPVCQKAANNLAACTCAANATVMITPPCRNNLNPPACKAAVAQLQACVL